MDNAKFKICPSCGEENLVSAGYCINCNKKITESSTVGFLNIGRGGILASSTINPKQKCKRAVRQKKNSDIVFDRTKTIKYFKNSEDLLYDLRDAIELLIEKSKKEYLLIYGSSCTLINLVDLGISGKVGYEVKVSNAKYLGRAKNYLDCPAKLICGQGEFFTKLIRINTEDKSLIIEVSSYLGKSLDNTKIEINEGVFYNSLLDRLGDFDMGSITKQIFINNCRDISRINEKNYINALNQSQNRAISYSIDSPISVIWGPPGTGKTKTASRLVYELVRRGKKVLITSHSNAAVDVFACQIGDELAQEGALKQHHVIRIGSSYGEKLKLKFPEMVDWRKEIVYLEQQITQLNNDIRENQYLSDVLDRKVKELEQLKERTESLESKIISNADVTCSTLSALFMSKEMASKKFDVVIVDEASMAPLAYMLWATTRCSEKFVIVGDFMQLPPVCKDDEYFVVRWFGCNVYDFLSISSPESMRRLHYIKLLDTQYRMHPSISRIANQLFYGGYLRDGSNVLKYTGEAKLVSTNSELSICESERRGSRGSSRLNKFTAGLAIDITKNQLEANGVSQVAIIVPYNSQARYIRNELRRLKITNTTVSTIHKFQGDEADCVIFDSVVAKNCRSAKALSDSNKNLINVALTRAKKRLYILADKDLIRRFGDCKIFYKALEILDN